MMRGKMRLLLLLLLALPLMGNRSEDLVGCSCGGLEEGRLIEVPSGGGEGIAGSSHYLLKRSRIGPSWEPTTSSEWDLYRVSATLGHYTTRGRAISDDYIIHHPMSRDFFVGDSGE